MTSTVYVNTERTVMVRDWGNGNLEVASRKNTSEVWSPPVTVEKEHAGCTCSATGYSTETQAGVALDTFNRRHRGAESRIERCACGMYRLTGATA